jgi:hypothetical protein
MYAREVALPEKTLLDFPQRLLYVRQWHVLFETNCGVKAPLLSWILVRLTPPEAQTCEKETAGVGRLG